MEFLMTLCVTNCTCATCVYVLFPFAVLFFSTFLTVTIYFRAAIWGVLLSEIILLDFCELKIISL